MRAVSELVQSRASALEDVAAWTREQKAKDEAWKKQPPAARQDLPPPRGSSHPSVGQVPSAEPPDRCAPPRPSPLRAHAHAPRSATELRERGNEAFKRGAHEAAEALYGESLAAAPSAAAFANRALARLKLSRFFEAEQDCSSALALDERHLKALQRRAVARRELGLLFEAACDCDTAARLEPSSVALREERARAVAAHVAQEPLSLDQPPRTLAVSAPPGAPVAPPQTRMQPASQQAQLPSDSPQKQAPPARPPFDGGGEAHAVPPRICELSDKLAAEEMREEPTTPKQPPAAPMLLESMPAPPFPPAAAAAAAAAVALPTLPPPSASKPASPLPAAAAAAAAAVALLAQQPVRAPRSGAELARAWARPASDEQQLQMLQVRPSPSRVPLSRSPLCRRCSTRPPSRRC